MTDHRYDKLGSIQFIAFATTLYHKIFGITDKVSYSERRINVIFQEAENKQVNSRTGQPFDSSLFKKLAYITVMLVQDKPFETCFPKKCFSNSSTMQSICDIENHQNICMAFLYSLHCLEKSFLGSNPRQEISHEIFVSGHSFVDIVEGIGKLVLGCNGNPKMSTPILAVLYEQLVYKTNQEIQYGFNK